MERIYREENFQVTPQTLRLQETLFHNSNGYLGVRGTLEEGAPAGQNTMRGSYINGFYDIVPMKQAEKLCNLVEDKESMLNVVDTQTILFDIDGERFSLDSGELLWIERELDMDAGVTRRSLRWRSPMGREVELTFCRMASFTHQPLFTIDCTVTPLNFAGSITVTSLHTGVVANYSNPDDPRLSAEGGMYLEHVSHNVTATCSTITTRTLTSGLTLCSCVSHELSLPATATVSFDEQRCQASYNAQCTLQKGETLRLCKYTVLVDSLRKADCTTAAVRLMDELRGKLYELYEQQRAYLAEFWQHAQLTIEGDNDANRSVCFNLYQLLQAAGRDGQCSIAAKGLSGEGYEGHYFWDTEMYMMPFFILTQPLLAQQLLSYRYTTLEAARQNARDLGHSKGALYPWRTIHGKECSGYFPSGSAQYHINGAIAYAVVQYYLCTDDIGFMEQMGAEILLETARLWLDAGSWYKGCFVLHAVTGPDEYTCMVNNNFYTNVSARYNMNWAVKIVKKLRDAGRLGQLAAKLDITEQELGELSAAAAAMLLPYDDELGINPQDDSFLSKPVWDIANTPAQNFPLLLHYHPLHIYRYQVCKQADTILAYLVDPTCADIETMRRSYAYYETVTTHDSSLSTCAFSVVGSQLGLLEKAWSYFGHSAELDLMNTHGNSGDGVHTANMGGCYMAIVCGFGGLRATEEGLQLAPVVPGGWQSYSFTISYHGRLISVLAKQGGCTLRLIEGPPLELRLYGEQITIGLEGADNEVQRNNI